MKNVNQTIGIDVSKLTLDGTSKRGVLNIIRNKIVSRVFTIINCGTPYVELSKFSA